MDKVFIQLKKHIKFNLLFLVFTVFFQLLTISLMIKKHYNFQIVQIDKIGKIVITFIIIYSTVFYLVLKKINLNNLKLEKVFLFIVIPFGFIYMCIFPINTIPDEYTHFYRAYEISLGHLVSDKNDIGIGGRELPLALPQIMFNQSENENIKEWFKTASLAKIDNEKLGFQKYSNMSLYSFVPYIPQSLGITLSRLFTNKVLVMAYTARLFNFISFVTIIYYSIKLIPIKKLSFLLITLIPIVFQEAVSLAIDATTIAVEMFLISYVLYLKYEKKSVLSMKDYLILILSAITLALCKIVYVPLCLIIYIIPKDKFNSVKQKYILTTLIILLSFILNIIWTIYCSRYLIEFQLGVNSFEQFKYIISNPINYIFVFIRTFCQNIKYYINNILGDLSLLNCSISFVYKYLLLFILVFNCITDNADKKRIDISTKIIMISIFLIVLGLIFTSLYIQWTPLKHSIINGGQGRYFIPIIILLPFIFNNKYLSFNNKKILTFILSFIVFLNVHSIICIFMNYI